jgi:hypothetical protein
MTTMAHTNTRSNCLRTSRWRNTGTPNPCFENHRVSLVFIPANQPRRIERGNAKQDLRRSKAHHSRFSVSVLHELPQPPNAVDSTHDVWKSQLPVRQQPTALMSVFHMHVDDGEQVHESVLVLKPETDTLKPQRPASATSRFKGEFGGGGRVGDGVHVGVKPAGISKGAIQGMVWTERRAGRRIDSRGVFHCRRRNIYACDTNVQPRPCCVTLEESGGIKKYSRSAKRGFNIANSSCVRGTTTPLWIR